MPLNMPSQCANYNNSSCPKTQNPTTYVMIKESDLSDFSQLNLTSISIIGSINSRTSEFENMHIFALDNTCKQGIINFAQPKGFITIPATIPATIPSTNPLTGADISLLIKP